MGVASVGKVSKPGKRSTASRKPWGGAPQWQQAHNQRIGEVVHAYSSLHAALFMMFWRLAADFNHDLALSLWHTAKSDRAQRDMLEAVVRHREGIGPVARRAILWAIAATSELAGYRNDAAHTEMVWYYERAICGLGTKEQSRKRIDAQPLEAISRKLVGDLYAVRNYLASLETAMLLGGQVPLSKRPTLQLARSSSERTQKARRQAKKAARERQRQASLG